MLDFEKNNKKNFKIILSHLNILYIEDEESIRINIEKTLNLLANEIYSADSVEVASKILKTNRIDIIISDINLPQMNGIDFIKIIRKMDSKIPVIFLSAFTDKDYLLEATKLKLVDYLVKPIDFGTLYEALNKAVQEILENGRYIVNFNESITYNILQKKLYSNKSKNEIDLTSKEIDLLEYFIKHNQRVISHEEIKNEIWNDAFEVTDSALKNVLNKLRKKVGKDTIQNISGVGFRIHIS